MQPLLSGRISAESALGATKAKWGQGYPRLLSVRPVHGLAVVTQRLLREAFGVAGGLRSFGPSNDRDGANGQNRTDDPRFTKALLYRLSYVGLRL